MRHEETVDPARAATPAAGAPWSAKTPLLSIQDLVVGIRRRREERHIVRGVSLDVAAGEKVGVVGESGSGKTLTMLSVLQLLPPPVRVLSGAVRFGGRDLTRLDDKELAEVRGGEVAMVYQDPMSSLNPLLRIRTQITEALRAHGVDHDAAAVRTREVLGQVGLPDPLRIEAAFPHELSGGMLQRVMVAMALATSPRLLVADEPTTALDVTIQQQILDLVEDLQARTHMAVVWVTHDLGVVARLVDRVVVMYAGRVVEDAPTGRLFERPTHPYTEALLGSLPGPGVGHRSALTQIGGTPPDPSRLPPGCPYRARCPYAFDRCAVEEPPLLDRNGSLAACWKEPELWR
ncbi:MAG: transporter ATP-binding protein [Acidimicrobiaceae bacterium]|nr:transporter ATP-binding protein [Acidimicrobiaceae bacterium]